MKRPGEFAGAFFCFIAKRNRRLAPSGWRLFSGVPPPYTNEAAGGLIIAVTRLEPSDCTVVGIKQERSRISGTFLALFY